MSQEEDTIAQGQGQPAIVYPYSVKLEQTAKGVRVSVHVYAGSQDMVIGQAVATYLNAIETLQKSGVVIAPMEGGKA
jgi:hypothetical protein